MKNLMLAVFISISTLACTKVNDTSFSSVPAGTVLVAAQVPASVNSAFHAKYPNATGDIEFEKEDGNTVKVKFFIGTQRWQAFFNADGTFLSESAI